MTKAVGGQVAVPHLVGLAVPRAREVGHDAAVVVVGADVDGPPLGSLAWPGVTVVTGQDPVAGTRVPKWADVRITFRPAGGNEAGDREPRLLPPGTDEPVAHVIVDDG